MVCQRLPWLRRLGRVRIIIMSASDLFPKMVPTVPLEIHFLHMLLRCQGPLCR